MFLCLLHLLFSLAWHNRIIPSNIYQTSTQIYPYLLFVIIFMVMLTSKWRCLGEKCSIETSCGVKKSLKWFQLLVLCADKFLLKKKMLKGDFFGENFNQFLSHSTTFNVQLFLFIKKKFCPRIPHIHKVFINMSRLLTLYCR